MEKTTGVEQEVIENFIDRYHQAVFRDHTLYPWFDNAHMELRRMHLINALLDNLEGKETAIIELPVEPTLPEAQWDTCCEYARRSLENFKENEEQCGQLKAAFLALRDLQVGA